MDENAVSPTFGCDSADLVTFNSEVIDLPSFDHRSVDELKRDAFEETNAIQRERAIWELAYRDMSNTGQILKDAFESEPTARIRANLLWLARKTASSEVAELIDLATKDEHPEVRDWAKLHLSELRGTTFDSEYDSGVYLPDQKFDQTLPLEIAGFAVVTIGNQDLRVVLSPLWFAHIQGRVMACTREETFMSRLTIEKRYEEYHPDGSDHYEIYPFAGKSWHRSELETEHRYLTNAEQRFYFSGRVEEDCRNSRNVPMAAARCARVEARLIQTGETSGQSNLEEGAARKKIVSHVKGQYFGWAFASTKHYVENGDILPGTVQLINPVDPELSSMVNCYICGTFRGKVADHNGDGLLDVNEIECHGLEDGRLDYNGDGTLAADPFA